MTEVLQAGGRGLMLDQMFGFYCTAAVFGTGLGPRRTDRATNGRGGAVELTSF